MSTKRKGLTKTQLEKMATYLHRRQHWLHGEIGGRIEGTEGDRDRGGDDVDLATMSVNSEIALDARARESRELQLIEQALRKVADGRYGLCEECGGTIAVARLEALPFAQFCIGCQERMDELGITAERREYQTLD